MSNRKKCKNCGNELTNDSVFCPYCGSNDLEIIYEKLPAGQKLESSRPFKRCIECGKELPNDSKFCQYCGSKRLATVGGKTNKKSIFLILACIASVLLLIVAFSFINNKEKNNQAEISTSEPSETTKKKIYNGLKLSYNELDGQGGKLVNKYTLYFTNNTSKNILVYLQDRNAPDNYCAFIVMNNDFYNFYAPIGTYDAFFAVGSDFYGLNDFFGKDTLYYRYMEDLSSQPDAQGIAHSNIEISLNSASIEPITRNEFPVIDSN